MFLENVEVNFFAVLVAAIVYWILGAVWYSPKVFGSLWMKHDGGEMTMGRTAMVIAFVGEFIIGLIMAYILGVFIEVSHADSVIKGVAIGFWVWLGFVATSHFSAVLWGRKSLVSYFVHSGFLLAGLLLMSAIIAGLK